MRAPHLVALLLAAVFWSALCRADEDAASRQKREGNEAMLSMRYADALAKYQEAHRLAPNDASILYNLGRAHQLLGNFPEALVALEQFSRLAPDLSAKVPKFDELLQDVRSRVATITVRCTPAALPKVLVLYNDKVIADRCTGEQVRIAAGRGRVRVEADGYVAGVQEVALKGGVTQALSFELLAAEVAGTLRLRSEPPAASVDVDGKPRGATPLEMSVPAGQHAVRAHLDGYDDASLVVDVVAGRTSEAPPLRLHPTPSILTRWWFWTVAGVVVAGGVALTIALLTEKPAPEGNTSPGQLSAPLIRF